MCRASLNSVHWAAKGQKVPKNQLKNAVIKALDILIGSDPTDRSVGTLNMTKSILQNDIRESGVIACPRQSHISLLYNKN